MAGFDPKDFDRWLLDETPESGVVLSSRARIARNLPQQPFPPRANADQLRHVAESTEAIIRRTPTLSQFTRFEMDKAPAEERCFLRESHLISAELEKGGSHRSVFVSPNLNASLMVNEEDHLRVATLIAGSRMQAAYDRLQALETELEGQAELAFADDFGYLTACPTNTGTGLRLSALMHLPALAILEQIEITLADLPGCGLTVRGAYGENTANFGDLYQISNEMTLGRGEEELMAILERIVGQIVEREMIARERLLRDWRGKLEDLVCRALGTLATARRMDSAEAVALLSRLRLGIGQSWGIGISHPALSRLFVSIQPGHLQCSRKGAADPIDRDQDRAALLRSIFGGAGPGYAEQN
jgi:protein arginine kinase